MTVFELMAKINLDSAGFDKGISGVKKGFSTLGKVGTAVASSAVVATTAMSGALLKTASDTAEYGDNVDKMSQKMGLSAQAYQEWDAIMKHSGTSIDSMKASMKTLANAVENNNGAFERLGITQEELANMNQEEIFAKTISSLQNVKDDTERTYLAGQLLGRGATELGALLNMSSEETEAMRQKVHDLGGVMSDEAVKASARYKDSLQDMKTAFEGLKRNMGSEFLPALSDVMDGLGEVFSGSSTGLEKIDKGVQTAVDKLSDTVPKFLEIGGKIISSVGKAIIDNAPKLFDAGLKMVGTLSKGILDNSGKVIDTGFKLITQLVSTISKKAPDFISAGAKAIINLAKGIAKNLPKLIKEMVNGLKNVLKEIGKNINKFLDAGMDILDALIDGFVKAFPTIVTSIIQFITQFVSGLASHIDDIIEGGFKLFIGLFEGIIKAIPEIVKAIPQLLEAIAEGLASGFVAVFDTFFNLFNGLSDPIEQFRDKAEKAIDDAGTYAEKLKNIQPTVAEYNDMISSMGNKWSDIQNDIQTYSDKINTILSDAIKKRDGLNNNDIENLRKYNEKLQEKYTEQLSIYRDAQISTLRMVQSDLSGLTLENATQYQTDAKDRLDQSNEMTKQWWQSEITRIENLNKARGTLGTELYNQELSQAKAQYDAKIKENEDYYNQTIELIRKKSSELTQSNVDNINTISASMTILDNALNGTKDLGAYSLESIGKSADEMSTLINEDLANMNWAQAEGYLNLLAGQRKSGANLTREEQDFVDNMLYILEHMTEEQHELYDEGFEDIAQLLDDDFPGLATKWGEGTDSFIHAMRKSFGFNERSDNYRLNNSKAYKVSQASAVASAQAFTDNTRDAQYKVGRYVRAMDLQFNPLKSWLYQRGVDGINGLFDGSEETFDKRMDGWAVMITGIPKETAETLDEHSPSKVMEKIGRFAGEGFGIGWENSINDVISQIEDDFNFASATVSPEFITDNVIEAESGFNYDALRDIMVEAMDGMTWEADDREVARLVRKYA